jgi:oxygen-dependent protoporphyrinogen oxidase
MCRRVVVVGGGVAGLAAAHRLRRSFGPGAAITVVEQTHRLGGKLRTTELAGAEVDLGAEAFLARRPEVPELAAELGLAEEIIHPGPASARVRAGGELHRLPVGTFLGVPASAEAVADVLSEGGVRAVRAERELPPLDLRGADAPVGGLLRERVGDEVVDRLVEPLLGGVYAGSADGLGLRATMPALAEQLDAGAGSITAAVSRLLPPPADPFEPRPPVFGAFRGGYRQLVDRLVAETSPQVRTGKPVRALRRAGSGWVVEIGSASDPERLSADAVVLAVPAPSARRLLRGVAEVAAESYAGIDLASMIVVGMALPPGTELPGPSGVLLARGERHRDGTPFTAKAFTFSSSKWPHLRGARGEPLLRASVGRSFESGALRLDDEQVLRAVRADLAELTGVTAEPVDAEVVRWGGGLPQYGVDHLDGVEAIERAVAEMPGLAVAGAALRGVGVPACIATGEAAAGRVAGALLAV